MLTKTKRSIFTFLENRQGNLTVELAFVMVLLAAMVVGGYDFSRMMSESHQLDQIARSATQYGIARADRSQDTMAILAAAEAAAGNDAGEITVTQSTYCLCPGVAATCGDVCADGSTAQQYLQVTVTKPYNFLFLGPSEFGAVTLTGAASMPVT